MKKLIAVSSLAFIAFPIHMAFATLPNPTTLESIPPQSKYNPPCQRGDIYIGNVCVDRWYSKVLQKDAMERRRMRLELRQETHRTQREQIRNIYLHSTGVRAARSNGFELLEPNSRQYRKSETTVQTNLRNLRAAQRKLGAARSRMDTTPRARWTTRTKQNYFWSPENTVK